MSETEQIILNIIDGMIAKMDNMSERLNNMSVMIGEMRMEIDRYNNPSLYTNDDDDGWRNIDDIVDNDDCGCGEEHIDEENNQVNKNQ